MRRTMHQLIEEYALDLRSRGRSEHTIRWYQQKLGHFGHYLQKRRESIERADRGDLREFILMLQKTKADANNPYKGTRDCPLSPYTVKGYVQVIKGFSRWLVAEDYLPADPFRQVALPTVGKKEMDTVSDEQMEELVRAAGRSQNATRDTALLWMLYGTGVRLSELTGLQVEDVHFSKGYAKVRGKGAKERLVPLGTKAQNELARYLRERPASEDGTLFLSHCRTPLTPSGVYRIVARIAREARVRTSPHRLRHTFATQYLLNGGDPESLRLILGHETLDMTMRYVHLTQKHLSIQHQRYSPADALWARMRGGRRRPKALA